MAFFLAHADKLAEKVRYFSQQQQEERDRLLSPNELLTWAESLTVATSAHPHPLPSYDFSARFPDFPFIYRRSVIKDAKGLVRSFLSNLATWRASGKKQGRPGSPGASNHPTLYDDAFSLDPAWENQSPKLILRPKTAALHFSQVKTVAAKKVKASKEDPHLVTVAVDVNVKNLAVITVRQDGAIIETLFVRDHGLDRHRYGHLKRIARKQWQSGTPVKGEHSNQQL